MSHQKCDSFNYMLLPLGLIVGATFVVKFNEVYVLAIYTVITAVVHIDYGVGVVSSEYKPSLSDSDHKEHKF